MALEAMDGELMEGMEESAAAAEALRFKAVPEMKGLAGARDRLWRERCAYVVNEALARGETEGGLRAPYTKSR